MRPASDRDRKDWLLPFLFLLLGILFMLVAGQRAIQLAPRWDLRANLGSNLDLNSPLDHAPSGIEPLRPEILTPAPWNDTFLTPTGDQPSATAPTFVVFDPSATPSPSPTVQPTNTIATQPTQPTVTTTVTATKTKKPKGTPTTTATATASPSPSVTSTIDPALTALTPAPAGYNEGSPDGSFATVPDNNYTVVTLSSPIVVTSPTDTAPDMAYYERLTNPTQIAMDSVIVGISQDPSGNPYYEVFNWGDGTPDANTNVDITTLSPAPNPASPPEADNAAIDTSSLYPSPAGTGITIDVDNASSHPPPGSYSYVVIIAPASPPNDGNDGAEVDAVEALP
jgi:hypothetical protein